MEVSTFMTSLISAAMFSIHANASVKLIGKIGTVTNILWNVYNGIHWILGCSCQVEWIGVSISGMLIV